MANPIAFHPKIADPKMEIERRLNAAPREHAEALLVLYDLLEEAHRQGLLDLLHGAVGSKDMIFSKIAEYAGQPESIAAVRNLLALARTLGNAEPEYFAPPPAQPPSLRQILRRIRSEDGRRGLGWLASLVVAVGRANGRPRTKV